MYNGSSWVTAGTSSLKIALSDTTGILPVSRGGTGSTTLLDNGLLIGAGTNPVEAVPMGAAGYLLMVNSGGTGYTWVSSTTAGVDTYQTDNEVRDLAGALSATSSGGLITITYVNNGDATSYLDYDIDTDLSNYNNLASKFFSTTTDTLLAGYGGTGITNPGAYGNVLISDGSGGYVLSATTSWDTHLSDSDISGFGYLKSLSLNDIAGVSTSSEDWGDLLMYNGSSWVTAGTSSLKIALSDTTGILPVSRGGTGSTTLLDNGLLIGAGTNPVEAVPMGAAGYLLMVNSGGTGYTWVSSTTAGVDTYQTDNEVRDLAGALSATSSGGLMTITYVNNGDATSYLDYDIDTDLSNYNNLASKFFSTTTDTLLAGYGGTGITNPGAYGNVLISDGSGGYVLSATTSWDTYLSDSDISGFGCSKSLSLNDIAGVSTSSEDWGDLLMYNGSSWVTAGTSSLKIALSDTTGILPVSRGGTGSTHLLDNGLLIGAGTNPVEAVPMGAAGYNSHDHRNCILCDQLLLVERLPNFERFPHQFFGNPGRRTVRHHH